jgi:hypothetical protein
VHAPIASLAGDLFVPQVSLGEKAVRALRVFLVAALRLGGKRERSRRGDDAVRRQLRLRAARLWQPAGVPDPRRLADDPAGARPAPRARALRSAAITVEELHAAALERGFGQLADVDLIVLQPNGHLAIMGREAAGKWRARQAS